MEKFKREIDGGIKKCKCIQNLNFFLIDDSFDENSKLNGGLYSFVEGEIYDFFTEKSWAGTAYMLIHEKHGIDNPNGVDEFKFLKHFREIRN